MRSVTEYHGGPKCLTRVRLATRMVATTFLANFLMISLLIYLAATGHSMLLPVGIYGMVMLVIWTRGYRLKKRVAELVEAAGQRIGLKRVDPRKRNIHSKETDKDSNDDEKKDSHTENQVSPLFSSEVSPLSDS